MCRGPVDSVVGLRCGAVRASGGIVVYGLRQVENLLGEIEQLHVLPVLLFTVCHCWSATTCRFASARFWLIITKVERKIASSETIIVRRPYGYFQRLGRSSS